MVEIGAGFGRFTAPLCGAGARVVAVELDPELAASLRRRYGGDGLTVVAADILSMPLPGEPHRVLGNIPFAITTPARRSRWHRCGEGRGRSRPVAESGA